MPQIDPADLSAKTLKQLLLGEWRNLELEAIILAELTRRNLNARAEELGIPAPPSPDDLPVI